MSRVLVSRAGSDSSPDDVLNDDCCEFGACSGAMAQVEAECDCWADEDECHGCWLLSRQGRPLTARMIDIARIT